jgi:RNA polymerase sigma-70 factor (ECF subfamily)
MIAVSNLPPRFAFLGWLLPAVVGRRLVGLLLAASARAGGQSKQPRNAAAAARSTAGGGPPLHERADAALSLEALIQRARRGDRDAFGEIYRKLAPRIHRFASFRCSDAALADDLTHETFVQAFRALERYEHRSSGLFVQWMYGIARRVVAEHYRRRRPTAELPADLVAHGAAGAEGIERVAGDLAVHEALAVLTSEQREVIELRFFQGLTHEEVGDRIGRRPGAVRALQFRGLQALRGALE